MNLDQNQFPEGWILADAEKAKRLLSELQKEIPKGHILKNCNLKVVAHRDGATDDVLCQHIDDLDRFTVVHLTWRMKEEIDSRFPIVEADGDFLEFLKYEKGFDARS